MTELTAPTSGWISDIDAMALALVTLDLGAGRKELDDKIDHAVGMILDAQVGEWVEDGEAWVTVQHRGTLEENIKQRVKSALTLSQKEVEPVSRIDEFIHSEGDDEQ
jgi:thymidine phosphorylase